jgi:hypothetical protein
MLSVTALIVVGLATWQAVEIYRHSSLFESWRHAIEGSENLLDQLLSCGWCLSVWVATILAIAVYLPLVQFFVYGLAISRLANVLHDAYRYLEEQHDNEREDRDRHLEYLPALRESVRGPYLNSPHDPRQDD